MKIIITLVFLALFQTNILENSYKRMNYTPFYEDVYEDSLVSGLTVSFHSGFENDTVTIFINENIYWSDVITPATARLYRVSKSNM